VALELDCGIDVEQLSARGSLMGVAEKMFAASEQQDLIELDGQALLERFYCYWTLREAYCKALGVGIAHTKRNYRFLTDGDGRWAIGFDAPSDGESHHWQFALIKPTTEHMAALAIRTTDAAKKAIVHSFVVP
jgi:4'-phosphopantetheinyl transferase